MACHHCRRNSLKFEIIEQSCTSFPTAPPPCHVAPGGDGAIEKIDGILTALRRVTVRQVEQRRQEIAQAFIFVQHTSCTSTECLFVIVGYVALYNLCAMFAQG
jgi:hypothetical protein